ncbi:hypothetical protein Ciccas_012730 [Cichlidogyrus casuarinus]|uniref:Uncharacterized protein n=1 Tax=Cichlidogyrus casuarinus TaxID=1844966 RepID=A0ABD2PMI4_9PLAT
MKIEYRFDSRLSKHLEISPKTGYAQANDVVSGQIKFLPKTSIYDELSENSQEIDEDLVAELDPLTGRIRIPIKVIYGDFGRSTSLEVKAILSASHLIVEPKKIDFGKVSTTETISTKICLSNPGLLPLEFGFVGTTEFWDVQPGDGFGTISAGETKQFQLYFMPNETKSYNFQISCKSIIGK